jgi:AcrR family transcriptional regulator
METRVTATPDAKPRGTRLPRLARRRQLLSAAQEVFVENGYHAAAMDEIADRAGVSKPVLYQHFPGKLELYLALLDLHVDDMVNRCRQALASTQENKLRVQATFSAFFDFVSTQGEAFRLVFESDLRNVAPVRQRVERSLRECAEMVSELIQEDTGCTSDEAHLLGVGLVGMAEVSARYWLTTHGSIPKHAAEQLLARLAWRGISGFPQSERRGDFAAPPDDAPHALSPHALSARELTVSVYVGGDDRTRTDDFVSALQELFSDNEIDLRPLGPAVIGSWFRRFGLKVKAAGSEEDIARRLEKLEHALEAVAVDEPASRANDPNEDALSKLISAADAVDDFVVLAGSIILVKHTNNHGQARTCARTLSAAEVRSFERDPHLLRSPGEALDHLEALSAAAEADDVDGRSDKAR